MRFREVFGEVLRYHNGVTLSVAGTMCRASHRAALYAVVEVRKGKQSAEQKTVQSFFRLIREVSELDADLPVLIQGVGERLMRSSGERSFPDDTTGHRPVKYVVISQRTFVGCMIGLHITNEQPRGNIVGLDSCLNTGSSLPEIHEKADVTISLASGIGTRQINRYGQLGPHVPSLFGLQGVRNG